MSGTNYFETDDLKKWTEDFEKTKRKYERFFKSNDQLEYFVMLPLSDQQRKDVLTKLMTKEAEKNCGEEK